MKQIKKPSPCKNESSLEQYAYFLLSRKDYSITQLEKKLQSRIPENVLWNEKKIIQKLINNNILNDKRLAKRIIEIYGKKEQGFKLELRLKKALINKEDYEEFFNEQKENFNEKDALKLLIKKFKIFDKEKKDKYFRFLASKSIDFDLIKKAIRLFEEKN